MMHCDIQDQVYILKGSTQMCESYLMCVLCILRGIFQKPQDSGVLKKEKNFKMSATTKSLDDTILSICPIPPFL